MVQDLESRLSAGAHGPFGAAFGLDLAPGRALQEAAALDEAFDTDGDIQGLPISVTWASLLHLARPTGPGRWRLDPIVARLLNTGWRD